MRTESASRLPRYVVRGALGGRAADSAAALKNRWRAGARVAGLPAAPDQWDCPAVDALCAGLTEAGPARRTLLPTAGQLGRQRAEAGILLHEARDDLQIPLGLLHCRRPLRAELLDALTVGWSEESVERLTALPPMDVTGDLPTFDYLRRRLHELYREAFYTGRPVSGRYLLVLLETERTDDHLVREARLTTIHSALDYAFMGGESIVALTPRRAAVLAADEEPRLSDSLALLKSEVRVAVEEGRLPNAHVWRQPLPPDVSGLPRTLQGVLR